jgi:hypothetical protein
MLVALIVPAQQHPAHPATPPRNSDTLQPIPADRIGDSYAIYSLLLPGAPLATITPEPNQSWSMADATVSITDMNPAVPPSGELKAPPENVRAFNQAVHDFNNRQYQRFRLDPDSFHPRRPLPFIDQNQVNARRRSGDPHSGIVFFSAVYFNSEQTAALVYVNDWCANLCAAGQWVYLEKQSGQWVRRSGLIAKGA